MRSAGKSPLVIRGARVIRCGGAALLVSVTLCVSGVARAQKGGGRVGPSTVTTDTFGLQLMAEGFPSVRVPTFDSQTGEILDSQEAGYFGLRFSFPIYRYEFGRIAQYLPGLVGEIDFGYVAAGKKPGTGDDGFAVGGGLELRWQIPQIDNKVMPFIRFEMDGRLAQFTDITEGTLFERAFDVSIGAHLVHSIDLHVLLGGTYATSTAAGFGFAIGYLF